MTLRKEVKRALKKICTRSPNAPRIAAVHYTINSRAALKARLDAVTRDGMVAVGQSGMDCDCTKFSYMRKREVGTLVEEDRWLEAQYDWADGPLSIQYYDPTEVEEYSESRDLALEAFEDGHPHVVYY